jgi:hypothetical protein
VSRTELTQKTNMMDVDVRCAMCRFLCLLRGWGLVMLCVHPCHTWRRVCFMVAYFCIIKMKTKKH